MSKNRTFFLQDEQGKQDNTKLSILLFSDLAALQINILHHKIQATILMPHEQPKIFRD